MPAFIPMVSQALSTFGSLPGVERLAAERVLGHDQCAQARSNDRVGAENVDRPAIGQNRPPPSESSPDSEPCRRSRSSGSSPFTGTEGPAAPPNSRSSGRMNPVTARAKVASPTPSTNPAPAAEPGRPPAIG